MVDHLDLFFAVVGVCFAATRWCGSGPPTGGTCGVESEVGANPCPVREGQEVTVVYLADDPTQARPEQLLRTGTLVGVLFTFGGLFVGLAGATVAVVRYRG